MRKATLEYATPITYSVRCDGFEQFGRCSNEAEYEIKTRKSPKMLCEHHTDLVGYLPPKEKEAITKQ